ASIITDATGSFSATFTVPDISSGNHAIQAVDSHNNFDTGTFVTSLPPTANDQSVNGAENESITITLTGSDPDGDPLAFYIISEPSHGILSAVNQTTGQVVYTPTKNYFGTDSFTFVTNDCSADSRIATVTITISEGVHLPNDLIVVTEDEQGDPLYGY